MACLLSFHIFKFSAPSMLVDVDSEHIDMVRRIRVLETFGKAI